MFEWLLNLELLSCFRCLSFCSDCHPSASIVGTVGREWHLFWQLFHRVTSTSLNGSSGTKLPWILQHCMLHVLQGTMMWSTCSCSKGFQCQWWMQEAGPVWCSAQQVVTPPVSWNWSILVATWRMLTMKVSLLWLMPSSTTSVLVHKYCFKEEQMSIVLMSVAEVHWILPSIRYVFSNFHWCNYGNKVLSLGL